jgi:hypothetical protein
MKPAFNLWMLKPKSSQSSKCTHFHQRSRKCLKKPYSASKLLETVFWDRTGLLLMQFMQQGITIRSQIYCKTLKNFIGPFRAKCGMLTSRVVHLHDNARLHTAARTRAQLEQLNWEWFSHPPYSPDITPSDYHLFTRTYLKNWFGWRLNSNEELMEGVKTWLSSQAADFFDIVI